MKDKVVKTRQVTHNGNQYDVNVYETPIGFRARASLNNKPYGYTITAEAEDFLNMNADEIPDSLLDTTESVLKDGSWERLLERIKKRS